MRIVAIAAMAENRVIGRGNALPWHIPEDWSWFKAATLGAPVMFGRRSYFSLPQESRPLPGRANIVISKEPSRLFGEAVEVWDSPLSCVEYYKKLPSPGNFWIAGGEQIYRATLDLWDELYLSHITGSYDGDAFFPKFEDQLSLVETTPRASFVLCHYRRNI